MGPLGVRWSPWIQRRSLRMDPGIRGCGRSDRPLVIVRSLRRLTGFCVSTEKVSATRAVLYLRRADDSSFIWNSLMTHRHGAASKTLSSRLGREIDASGFWTKFVDAEEERFGRHNGALKRDPMFCERDPR